MEDDGENEDPTAGGAQHPSPEQSWPAFRLNLDHIHTNDGTYELCSWKP